MTKHLKLSREDLAQFACGTSRYYRHELNPDVMYTDAAKYIAEIGGAYWLLDLIVVSQGLHKRLRRQPFQVWALAVLPDNSATITVEDANHNVLLTQRIPFTDFPYEGVTLWFSGNVIYHPVEH